jgi:hypothetical protein
MRNWNRAHGKLQHLHIIICLYHYCYSHIVLRLYYHITLYENIFEFLFFYIQSQHIVWNFTHTLIRAEPAWAKHTKHVLCECTSSGECTITKESFYLTFPFPFRRHNSASIWEPQHSLSLFKLPNYYDSYYPMEPKPLMLSCNF